MPWISKIKLSFTWYMNKRHEYFLFTTPDLSHPISYLGVIALLISLFDPSKYSLSRMLLFFRDCLVAFDDLSNGINKGAGLRLGAGLGHLVHRWFMPRHLRFSEVFPALQSRQQPGSDPTSSAAVKGS